MPILSMNVRMDSASVMSTWKAKRMPPRYLTRRSRSEAITPNRRRRCCTWRARRSLVEQKPSCACRLASTVAQPSVAKRRFRKQATSSATNVKTRSGTNFSRAVLPQRPSDVSQRVRPLRALFRIDDGPAGGFSELRPESRVGIREAWARTCERAVAEQVAEELGTLHADRALAEHVDPARDGDVVARADLGEGSPALDGEEGVRDRRPD